MPTADSEPTEPPSPRSRSRDAGGGPILDLTAKPVDEGPETGSEAPPHEPELTDGAPEAPSADPSGPGPWADPAPPPRRGRGFASLLATGVLGGLVGAGLTFAVERWRDQRAPNQVEPRLAAIEQRIETLPGSEGLAAVERRIGGLEGAVRDAGDRAHAAGERATAAASRAEEALNRPAPDQPSPNQGDAAAVTELRTRVEALEGSLRNGSDVNGDARQDLARRQEEQDQRLAALAKQVADAAAASRDGGQGIERRLAEQERRQADQDQRFAKLSQQVDERLAASAREQEQRLAALVTESAARREAGSDAGVKLAAADHVAAALGRGAPYAAGLEALRRLGADPAALSALEPFAAGGAPTAAALAEEFRTLAPRLRTEARPTASGGEVSWTERLRRMGDALVTVRAVGPSGSGGEPGASAADPAATVGQALARGDVRAAVAAWDALPEEARRSAEAFGTKLAQRAAAAEAIHSISAAALGAVRPSSP